MRRAGKKKKALPLNLLHEMYGGRKRGQAASGLAALRIFGASKNGKAL